MAGRGQRRQQQTGRRQGQPQKTFRTADGARANDVESEMAKFTLWSRGTGPKHSKRGEKKQKAVKTHWMNLRLK